MAKYHMFVFIDADPRGLSQRLMKRLARGMVHLVSGLSSDEKGFKPAVADQSNEELDGVSESSRQIAPKMKLTITSWVLLVHKKMGAAMHYRPEAGQKWEVEFTPML
jgi:hypothetical protein